MEMPGYAISLVGYGWGTHVHSVCEIGMKVVVTTIAKYQRLNIQSKLAVKNLTPPIY
jgi:hypothetical protein